MGICLIKAIVFALLSVFVLMPGLLVLFGPPIDKTRHKDFVPKIPFVGKIDYATRFIVPVVFVVVAVLGLHFSNNCPYAYGYSKMCIRDRLYLISLLCVILQTRSGKIFNKL